MRDIRSLPGAFPRHVQSPEIGTRVKSASIMSVNGDIEYVRVFVESPLGSVPVVHIPVQYGTGSGSVQWPSVRRLQCLPVNNHDLLHTVIPPDRLGSDSHIVKETKSQTLVGFRMMSRWPYYRNSVSDDPSYNSLAGRDDTSTRQPRRKSCLVVDVQRVALVVGPFFSDFLM